MKENAGGDNLAVRWRLPNLTIEEPIPASRLQVFRQAIAQWGAPETVVSDHGAVFVALQPCLTPLAIQ